MFGNYLLAIRKLEGLVDKLLRDIPINSQELDHDKEIYVTDFFLIEGAYRDPVASSSIYLEKVEWFLKHYEDVNIRESKTFTTDRNLRILAEVRLSLMNSCEVLDGIKAVWSTDTRRL